MASIMGQHAAAVLQTTMFGRVLSGGGGVTVGVPGAGAPAAASGRSAPAAEQPAPFPETLSDLLCSWKCADADGVAFWSPERLIV